MNMWAKAGTSGQQGRCDSAPGMLPLFCCRAPVSPPPPPGSLSFPRSPRPQHLQRLVLPTRL